MQSNCRLFTCLAESPHMHFYCFGESWNQKVPLTSETIPPTTRCHSRPEARLHHTANAFRTCIRIQIEVAPQVWPMIKRLDDSNVIIMFDKGFAHGVQK